jgi:hypothetical protein
MYAAVLVLTALGFFLMALDSTPEVVAAGLLVVSLVAVALAASIGESWITAAADRRLALAVLFAFALVPSAIFLARQRSPVEVSLGRIEPKAGAAITITEPVARSTRPMDAPTPISVAFSSLEVGIEPSKPSNGRPQAEVLVTLPVRAEDCLELELHLGGSCGDAEPIQVGEPLTIESLNRRRSLIAEIDPDEVRSLELSESTPRSQRDVPVEWALAAGEGTIELELRCPHGTRVALARLPERKVARCGVGEASFKVLLVPPPGSGLSLFLNELSEFQSSLGGERVEAIIEAGHLEIAGASRDLPLGPVPVFLRASPGHSVYLNIRQSVDSGQNRVSLGADQANRVVVSNHDERVSWLDRNTDLVYFVLGLVAAALIPAVLEFALRRISE